MKLDKLDGTWWRFYRETQSGQNQSQTDLLLPPDATPVFRVAPSDTVPADASFYSPALHLGAADVAERVRATEPVQPGDVLELDPTQPESYSTPGYAMRWNATQSSSRSFIGKALGGLDGECGTVFILLMSP